MRGQWSVEMLFRTLTCDERDWIAVENALLEFEKDWKNEMDGVNWEKKRLKFLEF